MDKLFIPIIEGTDRPKRRSLSVANYITDLANTLTLVDAVLVDPVELDFSYSASDPKYSDIVKKADAFVIVVPEYNHSFPGTLKMLLDTELKKYARKPVALAGVSVGPWGGIRAIQSLVPVLRKLGLSVTSSDMYFPNAGSLFNEDGDPVDSETGDRVKEVLTELIWMAQALKWGRENLA